jgi:hypothetical protein
MEKYVVTGFIEFIEATENNSLTNGCKTLEKE